MDILEKILKKLDKLDVIENEIKNLKTQMLSLEKRVSSLEESYNQLRQDFVHKITLLDYKINNLDYRISSLEKKYDNIKYELESYNVAKVTSKEFFMRRGHFRRKGNGFKTTDVEWVEDFE